MAKAIRLSNEDYAELLNAEREMHDMLDELDKAEKCDIPCQEFRRIHSQYMKDIQSLRENYAPSNR